MQSYNSICVSLDKDTWSCELVPAYDYRSPSGQSISFMKGDELGRLEEDRRAFERYFRPRYDFRRTIAADIDAIRGFMRNHLDLAHWHMPVDNDDVERILKQAVKDGRIVPVVNYDQRTPVYTADRPYAPEYWGSACRSSRGGTAIASTSRKSFHQMAMESMGLSAEGAWAYIERYNAMAERINAALEAQEAKRWRLSEAQAFEYDADNTATSGDDLQTAWLSTTGGPPNQWLENTSCKKQWRLYDDNGNAAVDIDFGHDHGFGIPHSHNWDNGVRDKGNAFSLLPY